MKKKVNSIYYDLNNQIIYLTIRPENYLFKVDANNLRNDTEYKYFIINLKNNKIRDTNRNEWERVKTKYVCKNNITLQDLQNK